nr:MAG TPA: LysM [Caudoviricetes sp.]
MTTKAKAAIIATALITAGILTAGAIWRERIKPEPTDYLTFERVVYSGDSLWSLCERYSGYEDIQTIIMRVREDNGIENPGALQPGQKIKVRVRKGNR